MYSSTAEIIGEAVSRVWHEGMCAYSAVAHLGAVKD